MGAVGGAQLQGHYASCLQPWPGKPLGQCQQTQTGPVTMLGVFACCQQASHQSSSGHANAVAPMDQPLWCPFQMGAVRSGQVFGHRGEPALVHTAQVGRHTLTPVQQLHRACRHARFQDLTDQRLRDAVAVTFKLNVLVNMHSNCLVNSKLPGLCRQGLQGWGVKLRKRTGAAAGQLLKCLGIELFQERCDGLVDVIDRGKPLVAQAHQYPALHHLHGRFHLAFVLRVVRARWQYRRSIVPGKVVHRLIGPGFVPVRIGNQCFGVVGHDELGHATKETQRLGGGAQPVGHGLKGCGAGEGIARCT